MSRSTIRKSKKGNSSGLSYHGCVPTPANWLAEKSRHLSYQLQHDDPLAVPWLHDRPQPDDYRDHLDLHGTNEGSQPARMSAKLINTCIHACIHIDTYIHTHTYIHTYTHKYRDRPRIKIGIGVSHEHKRSFFCTNRVASQLFPEPTNPTVTTRIGSDWATITASAAAVEDKAGSGAGA